MKVYKLIWNMPNEGVLGALSGGSSYHREELLYLKKSEAETKEKELQEAYRLLHNMKVNFQGRYFGTSIEEIEVV